MPAAPTLPDASPDASLVLTTAPTPNEARLIARTLVEERLAACVSLIPAVESIYRWKDKIESSAEILLLIKTSHDQLPALQSRLHVLHSYEIPEFLVLEVDAQSSSHPYLAWLQASLRNP